MEIILLERVEKVGAIGDVVKVKDGLPATTCCRTRRHSAQTKATASYSRPTAPALRKKR